MASNEQFGDQEYVTKKEGGSWNRKGLVQTKKDDQTVERILQGSECEDV